MIILRLNNYFIAKVGTEKTARKFFNFPSLAGILNPNLSLGFMSEQNYY